MIFPSLPLQFVGPLSSSTEVMVGEEGSAKEVETSLLLQFLPFSVMLIAEKPPDVSPVMLPKLVALEAVRSIVFGASASLVYVTV